MEMEKSDLNECFVVDGERTSCTIGNGDGLGTQPAPTSMRSSRYSTGHKATFFQHSLNSSSSPRNEWRRFLFRRASLNNWTTQQWDSVMKAALMQNKMAMAIVKDTFLRQLLQIWAFSNYGWHFPRTCFFFPIRWGAFWDKTKNESTNSKRSHRMSEIGDTTTMKDTKKMRWIPFQ